MQGHETSWHYWRRTEAHFNDNYFLPIVFHNLKCYDGHFIIKNFAKKYVEHHGKVEKVTYLCKGHSSEWWKVCLVPNWKFKIFRQFPVFIHFAQQSGVPLVEKWEGQLSPHYEISGSWQRRFCQRRIPLLLHDRLFEIWRDSTAADRCVLRQTKRRTPGADGLRTCSFNVV